MYWEHWNAQMAYIINQARIKQRSLLITLLDLKNAFGKINHNLINSVLGYHHIPDHIKVLIKSLYTNFKTSIITSNFNAPFIPVGRGVLQEDCLSPLLFNLCFNTFIQHIKSDHYRQFGFSHKLLNPIHWFQFADDASVITSLETENQHLLNRFYHRPVTLGWNFFSLLTIAQLPFSLPPLPFQFSSDGTATGQNQYISGRSKALKVG